MAKCYVGTYGKYNAGSIDGAWLDLANYQTYGEFVKACRVLHKNERDPEFMIQDWENLPDGFPAVEWISEQEFNEIKSAMAEEQSSDLSIIDYSDKCIAVVGETRAIKDTLKKLGGRFNGRLSCGAGWVFPKTKLDSVQALISGSQVQLGIVPKQEKDEALWEEYKKRINKAEGGSEHWLDYHMKNASDLMMTDGGVILVFSKPSIKVDFCWSDEGAPYEEYKRLMADDKELTKYFLDTNLREYDDAIKELTERKNKWGDQLVPVLYEHSYCSSGLTGWGNEIRMLKEWDVREDENDPRTRDCIHRLTENDAKKALVIMKKERAKFDKRLHTYLKRYGVSKLHTWTYWADR